MTIPNSEIKIPLTTQALSHSPKPPSVLPQVGAVEAFEVYTLWDIQAVEPNADQLDMKRILPTLAVKLYGIRGESDLELLNKHLKGSQGRYSSKLQVYYSSSLNLSLEYI